MAPLGLSDSQFTMVKFGVPVVAVFALSSAYGKKREAEAAAAKPPVAGGLIPASPLPSTDAIGVGQLAEFESGVTSALTQLTETVGYLVDNQQKAPAPAPAPATAPTYVAPPPPPPPPPPAPVRSCIPNWPCAPLGKIAVPIIVQGKEIGVQYI